MKLVHDIEAGTGPILEQVQPGLAPVSTFAMTLQAHQNMLHVRACTSARSSSVLNSVKKLCTTSCGLRYRQTAAARQAGTAFSIAALSIATLHPASASVPADVRGVQRTGSSSAADRRAAPSAGVCSLSLSQVRSVHRGMAVGAAASAAVAEEITPAPSMQDGAASGGRRLEASNGVTTTASLIDHQTVDGDSVVTCRCRTTGCGGVAHLCRRAAG